MSYNTYNNHPKETLMSNSGGRGDFHKALYRKLRSTEAILIIDCFSEKETGRIASLALAEKLRMKQPNNPILIIKGQKFINTTKLNEMKDNITGNIKIYILTHGSPGADNIKDENDQEITNTILAKRLADVIGNNTAVVNLVSCSAGRGLDANPNESPHLSLASKLHEILKIYAKKDIPVVARTQIMSVNTDGKKMTLPIDMPTSRISKMTWEKREKILRKKQPGSKIIFTTDENEKQVRLDAYKHKWKIELINSLEQIHKNTTILTASEKRNLLQKWISTFPNKSADEIAAEIRKELKNPASAIQMNDSFLSYFDYSDIHFFKSIQAQMERWEKIRESKFVLEGAQPTGRGGAQKFKVLLENNADGKEFLKFDNYTIGDEAAFDSLLTANSEEGKKFRRLIINALPEENEYWRGKTLGLFKLVAHFPNAIFDLYTAAEKNREEAKLLNDAVSKALFQNEGWNLISLAIYAPSIVSPLIEKFLSNDNDNHDNLNNFFIYLFEEDRVSSFWKVVFEEEDADASSIVTTITNKLETLSNEDLDRVIERLESYLKENSPKNTNVKDTPNALVEMLLDKVQSVKAHRVNFRS